MATKDQEILEKASVISLKDDEIIISGGLGNVAPEETINYIVGEFWDDLSGEALDPEGVKQARREELEEVKKHRVYRNVPIN